jgi:hypothetical protein
MTDDERPRGHWAVYVTFLGILGRGFLAGVGLTLRAQPAQAAACSGCGCKGGPGYRGPNGRCVSWDALAKTCGTPPTTHCKGERVNVREPVPPVERPRPRAPQRERPAPKTVPNPF